MKRRPRRIAQSRGWTGARSRASSSKQTTSLDHEVPGLKKAEKKRSKGVKESGRSMGS